MTILPGPELLQFETTARLWTLCTLDAPPDIVLRDWKCFDLTPPGNPLPVASLVAMVSRHRYTRAPL